MATYLIQNIPDNKRQEFKTACSHFNKTMREELLDLMETTISAYRRDTGRLKAKRTQTKKKE